jgi:hypothetical protein
MDFLTRCGGIDQGFSVLHLLVEHMDRSLDLGEVEGSMVLPLRLPLPRLSIQGSIYSFLTWWKKEGGLRLPMEAEAHEDKDGRDDRGGSRRDQQDLKQSDSGLTDVDD